ncbi:fimbrial protein precursor [Clostridium homopropionicum DSM 5847]|uniref:Fimbrial protein n=1 Tax=Clostridium homopropionicum DSM 5847 TaxID=1121318 RepID=A0A0L6ZF60_9CLOT|nr:type II secretion system protein [Clostridium homopropionicum]KOA21418.1 fimbrial protein precursor [Clostridium homopropionicum DSM 5847]SFG10508.1 type IV pilus assembly protein PilA [Clostridium homopropionicum]
MIKNLKKKRGFTLIELIIVIAILGILAAIAIPKFSDVQSSARKKADISSAKTIADTAAMLIADEQIAPGTANVTAASGAAGAGTNISLADAGGSGKLIADALNSVPAPKVKGTAFVVTITSGGVVSVSVKDGTNYYDIYPAQHSDWQ